MSRPIIIPEITQLPAETEELILVALDDNKDGGDNYSFHTNDSDDLNQLSTFFIGKRKNGDCHVVEKDESAFRANLLKITGANGDSLLINEDQVERGVYSQEFVAPLVTGAKLQCKKYNAPVEHTGGKYASNEVRMAVERYGADYDPAPELRSDTLIYSYKLLSTPVLKGGGVSGAGAGHQGYQGYQGFQGPSGGVSSVGCYQCTNDCSTQDQNAGGSNDEAVVYDFNFGDSVCDSGTLSVTFDPYSIPDWITIVNSSTDYVRTLTADDPCRTGAPPDHVKQPITNCIDPADILLNISRGDSDPTDSWAPPRDGSGPLTTGVTIDAATASSKPYVSVWVNWNGTTDSSTAWTVEANLQQPDEQDGQEHFIFGTTDEATAFCNALTNPMPGISGVSSENCFQGNQGYQGFQGYQGYQGYQGH